MDFAEILRRAWQIIWKHKILWIFGIMAGCARGGGGGGGGGGNGFSWQQSQPFGPGAGSEISQWFTQVGDWIGSHLWVAVLFVILLLLFIVLSIFLGTVGKIGLIRGTLQADGGADRIGFADLFRESLPFFWRVFGLSFLVGLAVLLLVLILLVPVIAFTALTFGLALLCILQVLCILIPVAIAVGLVIQLADSAMVIEDRGIGAGVRRAWEVLKANVGSVLIIWLILAVIGFVVGIVIALPVLVIVIPAAITFAAGGQQPSALPLIIGGACLVVYLPVLLVANGVLTAYLDSAWTLTYLRLTRPKEGQEPPAALPANA